MNFTKMHGIGNDYVYINGFVELVADPVALAQVISDRHFGVGSDGLILILPSDRADVRMRMFNADGSESEMCGNGVRCVAKYAFDHGLTRSNPMKIETGRGVLTLDCHVVEGKVREVTVNMGEPILTLERIPVLPHLLQATSQAATHRFTTQDPTQKFDATFVSMGNPHAVLFVEDVAKIEIERLGPLIEHAEVFPRRINVHWVQVISRDEVIMRTWERGSGVTLACGTGACAVAVAGVLTGKTGPKILAHLPGGDLELNWRTDTDKAVLMKGAATEVFTGEWNR